VPLLDRRTLLVAQEHIQLSNLQFAHEEPLAESGLHLSGPILITRRTRDMPTSVRSIATETNAANLPA